MHIQIYLCSPPKCCKI